MKTKMIKSAFADACNAVKGLLLKDRLSPFSKTLLDVAGPNVALTASNGDVMVTWRFQGDTEEDGAYTVHGASLAAFVASLPEGTVELATEGKQHKAKITDGHTTFKLATDEASDFPSMTGPKTEGQSLVPAATMREMLRKVKYAACTDGTRCAINGVSLVKAKDMLSVTATDGRRLSHVEVESREAGEFDVILPIKAVATLMQLLSTLDAEGDTLLSLQADDRAVRITGPQWCMTALVVADKYPDWRKVVPETTENEVSFDRVMFLAALERVSLVPKAEENGIVVDIVNDSIKLSARSDGESAEAEVYASAHNPDVREGFRVNPRFVKDILNSIDDDEIHLGFSAGIKPLVFRCSVPFVGVIMPMRLA